MKKAIFILPAVFMLTTALLTGCGNSEKKQDVPAEVVKEQYQCPMKCTEEVFGKPGNCSVCGMELEKITKS
jgi:heavy metal-binding protein